MNHSIILLFCCEDLQHDLIPHARIVMYAYPTPLYSTLLYPSIHSTTFFDSLYGSFSFSLHGWLVHPSKIKKTFIHFTQKQKRVRLIDSMYVLVLIHPSMHLSMHPCIHPCMINFINSSSFRFYHPGQMSPYPEHPLHRH